MRLYGIFIALLLLHRYLRLKQKTSSNSISESEVKAPAAITAWIYNVCAWHALHIGLATVSSIQYPLVYGEVMMRRMGGCEMLRQGRETIRSENLPQHVKWDGASDECSEPGTQHFAGWQISPFWSQSLRRPNSVSLMVSGAVPHILTYFFLMLQFHSHHIPFAE